jgi:exopolysaccharide production protein ExoZ
MRTYINVQYLRFVAAALVVASHCYQIIPKYGAHDIGTQFELGGSGVDIFFAISGFIMVVITEYRESDSTEFFLHRLTRVAPMYWLLTAIMAITLVVAPALFASSKLDILALSASFLFVPWPSTAVPGAAPLLPVGWTLNFEFIFYGLFAVAMATSYRKRVEITSLALMSLAAIGMVFKPLDLRAAFITSSILIEFVFGMLIAKLLINRRLPGAGVCYGLIIVGVMSLIATLDHVPERLGSARPLEWGLPAAMIVLGAVGLEVARRESRIRLLAALGDASYSIYLTHLFTLGALRFVWARWHLGQMVSDVFLLAFGLFSALLVGYLAYLFVEKPLTNYAKIASKRVIPVATRSAA